MVVPAGVVAAVDERWDWSDHTGAYLVFLCLTHRESQSIDLIFMDHSFVQCHAFSLLISFIIMRSG